MPRYVHPFVLVDGTDRIVIVSVPLQAAWAEEIAMPVTKQQTASGRKNPRHAFFPLIIDGKSDMLFSWFDPLPI